MSTSEPDRLSKPYKLTNGKKFRHADFKPGDTGHSSATAESPWHEVPADNERLTGVLAFRIASSIVHSITDPILDTVLARVKPPDTGIRLVVADL